MAAEKREEKNAGMGFGEPHPVIPFSADHSIGCFFVHTALRLIKTDTNKLLLLFKTSGLVKQIYKYVYI